MVGFRKGFLGCPFSTEYNADMGMDIGSDTEKVSQRGPKIGAGVLGKRVMMEVDRDFGVNKSGGRGGKRGRGGPES